MGIGKAEGVPQEIVDGLRANFEGECSEVGMYLAMARVAEREGYPEIAEAYKRYAYEEADHASRFAELLGERPVRSRDWTPSRRRTRAFPSERW